MSGERDIWAGAPDVLGFTVDAADSADLDDAIWAEETPHGFRVVVSITAVSEVVERGSAADERALERVETRYGKTRNWPMLPRRVADREASLLPGEPRRVVTVTVDLDRGLKIASSSVGVGVLRSVAKLAHGDVPPILAEPGHALHKQMSLLCRVAQGLVDRRRAAGAFVFYDLNHGWISTEEGHVRKLKDTRETIGHIVVQEMMILANCAMAELCAREEIPVPFRNHTAKAHAPDRQEIVDRLAAGLREPLRGLEVLQKQVNLVMNRADYGTTLKGHYGLNVAAYLHGTSPIRRYADLVAQRQILAHLRGRDWPHAREAAEHVCRVINSTLVARREEDEQYHRERAERQAHEAVTGDVDLAKLSAKEFERVVKVIVRAGKYVPELTLAFTDRVDSGTINIIDLYFGLLESPSTDDWSPLREVVVDHLLCNPEKAPSVVSMASNLLGWSTPTFDVSSHGPPHALTHRVVASMTCPRIGDRPGRVLRSPAVSGPGVKEAKQRALIWLLADAVGHALRPWDEEELCGDYDEIAAEVPSPALVPDTTDNPVAALQEFAQARGMPLPIYEDSRVGGQDHAPTYVCTCRFNGTAVRGAAAASKKAAKKLAAETMVRAMRGSLT